MAEYCIQREEFRRTVIVTLRSPRLGLELSVAVPEELLHDDVWIDRRELDHAVQQFLTVWSSMLTALEVNLRREAVQYFLDALQRQFQHDLHRLLREGVSPAPHVTQTNLAAYFPGIYSQSTEKSKALLKRFLQPAQIEQLEQHDYFDVQVPGRGLFRISTASSNNVKCLLTERHYCVQPSATLPIYDVMLTQKLLLEAAPDEFFSTALSPRPYIPIDFSWSSYRPHIPTDVYHHSYGEVIIHHPSFITPSFITNVSSCA